jgi:acyl carrier protein
MTFTDKGQLQEDIRGVVATIMELDPAAIPPEANLVADLGADSMNALELLATLEKRYAIVIDPSHLPDMVSLRRIADIVWAILQGGK